MSSKGSGGPSPVYARVPAATYGGASERAAGDSQTAAASFDRLCAMYADVAALQSAMGEELARLSEGLGRKLPTYTPAASSNRMMASPAVPPHTAPADLARKRQLYLRAIKEVNDREDDERSLFASARRFLPPWAQPSDLTALNA